MTAAAELFDRRVAPGQALGADAELVALACHDMARRFAGGGKLVVFGSGAAATDAQHLAVEFVHPVIVGKRAFPALRPLRAHDDRHVRLAHRDDGDRRWRRHPLRRGFRLLQPARPVPTIAARSPRITIRPSAIDLMGGEPSRDGGTSVGMPEAQRCRDRARSGERDRRAFGLDASRRFCRCHCHARIRPVKGGRSPRRRLSATLQPGGTSRARRAVPKGTLQLTINAAGTLDTAGRSIDAIAMASPGATSRRRSAKRAST